MFQLREKIIPAFEKAHGPGYQALIMVDNSQGHSAYVEDALLISRMNINPSGKQARMHDGWYLQNGEKIIQPMNFPPNHPEHPNEPKGVKAVLTKRGLYQRLRGKCKNKCESCCNSRILELQPDFKEQKSLVQEVIEAVGHLCIFLPKFHCELNFIEFFWGVVRRSIFAIIVIIHLQLSRKTCQKLRNLSASAQSGFGSTGCTGGWKPIDRDMAQLQVRNFSSAKYKSHRRIPETVAQAFN
jgi:transposase